MIVVVSFISVAVCTFLAQLPPHMQSAKILSDAVFKRLKEEIHPGSPGVRVLCPTPWMVRADSLRSVLDNYTLFCKGYGKRAMMSVRKLKSKLVSKE